MNESLHVPRLDEDFEIDGNPEKDPWSNLEEILLNDNNPENACSLLTSFKIGYTGNKLYILFKCAYDEIKAEFTNHDTPNLWEDDVVEAFLNPGNDDSRYFEFQCSAIGTTFDAMVHNPGHTIEGRGALDTDTSWDLRGFKSAVLKEENYYYVELAIPFEGFAKPASGDKWKGNFYRINWRDSEMELFAYSPTQKPDFHIPSRFTEIIFD